MVCEGTLVPLDKTLVIAPHPDDELLGCGGTLLRRKAEGAKLCWLIVTGISEEGGWPLAKVKKRDQEITKVATGLEVDQVINLKLPTTKLDTIPMGDLIQKFSQVFHDFEPNEILVPHRGDVHTDHRVVFEAAAACCKWFRYPSIKRVLSYETLSETELSLNPSSKFHPNYFVGISQYLEEKLNLLSIYTSEIGEFPFPRSLTAVKALAQIRGATSGFEYAEGFELLREIS